MRRREVFSLAGALLALAPAFRPIGAHAAAPFAAPVRPDEGEPDASNWRTLKIGAGGFIVGMDVAADGTFVVRADTYGAWIWEPARTAWRPLITRTSMPPEDRGEDSPAINWPLDLAIAPSDTARLYMALDGRVYRSDDRGRRWFRTACPPLEGMSGVAPSARMNGRKIAVDPRDPDVVYVAPPRGGMVATRDGGATWRPIEIPMAGEQGGEPMGGLVIFDPASPAIEGRTSTIYASPWGSGVHRSVDAGASWTRLPDGPSALKNAAIATDRALYAVSGQSDQSTPRVFRFDGAWADVTPPPATPEAWQSVTVSPADPARLLVCKEEGSLCESLDRGRSWRPLIHRSKVSRIAEDVPWLAWTDEPWVSCADVRFDPANPDRLLFAQGIGVWQTRFARGSTAVVWRSQNRDIEQLVSNQWVHPPAPGALPLLACWDRPIWRVSDPERYPTRHYPGRAFQHCWGIDYAGSDPRFLVATLSTQQATDLERSSYSLDGGANWRPFKTYPDWAEGKSGKGFIAASSAQNLVWSPSESRGLPHYTLDGGASWRPCELPGVTPDDAAGFGWANFIRRFCVCADRVKPGVFYLLHHPKGLFASEDGGRSWSHRHPFEAWNERFHSKLRATPGFAGHLFHTGGHSSADRHGDFIRSTDGGRTWTALPEVREVSDFAFGKAARAAHYPSLYIVGYVRDRWGIFRSTDEGATWRQVGDGFPAGSLDRIVAIEADKNVFGKVYIGFIGSGAAYGYV